MRAAATGWSLLSPTAAVRNDPGTVQHDADAVGLRGKVLSFRRRVRVHGGHYDSAELTGTLFDLSFVLSCQGQVLARAAGKVFSLRAAMSSTSSIHVGSNWW